MIRIPVSRYLLTNGLRPSRILVLRDIVFSRGREHLASEDLYSGTFMARPGLETSHTWGLTSSKKGTDSSFSISD